MNSTTWLLDLESTLCRFDLSLASIDLKNTTTYLLGNDDDAPPTESLFYIGLPLASEGGALNTLTLARMSGNEKTKNGAIEKLKEVTGPPLY